MVEEALYPAMEDFAWVVVGKGTARERSAATAAVHDCRRDDAVRVA